jgi:hypothetical protein
VLIPTDKTKHWIVFDPHRPHRTSLFRSIQPRSEGRLIMAAPNREEQDTGK